jgi:hypothetical protein
MSRIALTLTLLLAVAATPALARDYAKQAERAVAEKLDAITIFVGVTLGLRQDGAARELTAAHAAFARRGFEVVDIETYTENGDLEGFFVTYRRMPGR